jgi:hypothetical protein
MVQSKLKLAVASLVVVQLAAVVRSQLVYKPMLDYLSSQSGNCVFLERSNFFNWFPEQFKVVNDKLNLFKSAIARY